MIHLDYRDGRPIYQQVLDGFRDQIRAGIVGEGERMPSVRELAGLLAINPNTIQRAYRELESDGFIYSVSGKGSFAAALQEVDAGRRSLTGRRRSDGERGYLRRNVVCGGRRGLAVQRDYRFSYRRRRRIGRVYREDTRIDARHINE